MNDEFYIKFPSYNKNSKEFKRAQKVDDDYYSEFLRINQSNMVKNHKIESKSQNPISKSQPVPFDVFSVEERNRRAKNDSREKSLCYQKLLLQQIEESKIRRLAEEQKEQEKEKLFEERLKQQIQVIIQSEDPWQNRKVERISFSEKDKFVTKKDNNNIYRFFSKSSNNVFNRRNNTELCDSKTLVSNCIQCHKALDSLCYDCSYKLESNVYSKLCDVRTNNASKILYFKENYYPYTFDINSNRFKTNAFYDSKAPDYCKLYREFKKITNSKLLGQPEDSDGKYLEYMDSESKPEKMGRNNHQDYTVITGYAKKFLRNTS